MVKTLKFDSDTTFTLAEEMEVQDVHMKDLAFVLDIDHDGERVNECKLDLSELIEAMTVYSAQDKFRYGWRRRWRDRQAES